jgi:hypothetical protein
MKLMSLVLPAGVAAAAFVFWQSDDSSTLRVSTPEWFRAESDAGRDTGSQSAPTAAESRGVRLPAAATTPAAASAAVVAAMLPPSTLSNALLESRQPVRFEVEALMSADVSGAVAAEIVDAMTAHWALYEDLQRLRTSGKLPIQRRGDLALMDYLFAVWPDLGAMIRAGRTRLVVHPATTPPNGTRLETGAVFYTTNLPDRRVTITFHTPSWRVSAPFDEQSAMDAASNDLLRHALAVVADPERAEQRR